MEWFLVHFPMDKMVKSTPTCVVIHKDLIFLWTSCSLSLHQVSVTPWLYCDVLFQLGNRCGSRASTCPGTVQPKHRIWRSKPWTSSRREAIQDPPLYSPVHCKLSCYTSGYQVAPGNGLPLCWREFSWSLWSCSFLKVSLELFWAGWCCARAVILWSAAAELGD